MLQHYRMEGPITTTHCMMLANDIVEQILMQIQRRSPPRSIHGRQRRKKTITYTEVLMQESRGTIQTILYAFVSLHLISLNLLSLGYSHPKHICKIEKE